MPPTKTDTDATPAGPGTTTDPSHDSSGATMGDLRKVVAEVVEAALKPIKDAQTAPAAAPSSAPAAPASTGAAELEAMVQAAVTKVTGDAKAADADEKHRKAHEQLAARLETPPVDRPRRSRWLGNIWDK